MAANSGKRQALAALLLCAGTDHAFAQTPALDTEFSLGYDDNVSNSQHREDIESSRFATASIRHDHRISLGDQDALLLRGGLQAELHDNRSALNSGKLSGLMRVTHSFAGADTTSVSAWVSAALWEFNSELRDSSEYRAGVILQQRLAEKLNGRFSLAAARRHADSDVFDVEGTSVALDLDWQWSANLALYGGLQHYDGDVVSSSTAGPGILGASEARTPDDAFDSLIAYRLESHTWIPTLGFNYGLSRDLSVDFQLQHIDADAAGGNEYQRWIATGGLLARF